MSSPFKFKNVFVYGSSQRLLHQPGHQGSSPSKSAFVLFRREHSPETVIPSQSPAEPFESVTEAQAGSRSRLQKGKLSICLEIPGTAIAALRGSMALLRIAMTVRVKLEGNAIYF
jgi:hypothetical protein